MAKILKAFIVYKSLWNIKSFRNLWLGQISSQLANNTLIFVLAIRIYQLTSSNIAVSGLYLNYAIPAALFGLAAGAIVDKINPKTVLFYTDLIRALFILLLIFLPHNTIFIYIIIFINSVLTQFYSPSEAPTIPRLVPENRIMTANSLFAFTYYSSMALGSILAGPLMKIFGSIYIFALLSFLYFLSGFFVSKIPVEKVQAPYRIFTLFKLSPFYAVPIILREIKNSLGYIYSKKLLIDSLLILIGTQIIIAVIASLGPGIADNILKIDVRDASVILMGPAVIGIILGAVTVGVIGKFIKGRILIKSGMFGAGLSLFTIASLLYYISENRMNIEGHLFSNLIMFMMMLFAILGFSNAFLDVPANSRLQTESESNIRGKIYGLLSAGLGSIGILPVVIGGILADFIGPVKVLYIVSIVIIFIAITRKEQNSIN